mgnify:CR=1 FL=1
MKIFFASFGFLSLLFQIISLREISYLFSGHEIAISSALSFWIFWTAVGTIKISQHKLMQFFAEKTTLVFIFFAALFPVWIKAIQFSVKFIPYGIVPDFFTMLLMSALLISVPAIINGICIYHLVKLKSIDFYIWETVGAVGSGLFSLLYFYFAPQIPPEKISFFVSLLFIALSVFLLKNWKTNLLWAIVFMSLASAALIENSNSAATKIQTPYGKLYAEKKSGQTLIYENGHIKAQYPDDQFEENLVTIPLLAHKNPKKILFTSPEGLLYLRQAKKHHLKKIDIVSSDKWKYKYLLENLELGPGNARFIYSDPRNYLRKTSSKYDLIFVTNGNPENAALTRFYTAEFIRTASKKLSGGGLLVMQIPSSENYLSPNLAYFSACLLKTVRSQISHLKYVPGKRMTILASNSPIELNVNLLKKRYRQRKIRNKIYVPWNMAHLLGRYRIEWFNIRLKKVKKILINTDAYPISYFYLWKIWLSMSVSNKIIMGAVLSILLLLIMILKTIRNISFFRRNIYAFYSFIIGFWAITFEIALFLIYQSATGNLAWKMGVLFATFMSGTALGAHCLRIRSTPLTPVIIFISASVLSIILIFLLPAFYILPPNGAFAMAILLLFLGGGIVGGYFTAAVKIDQKQSYKIYAMDLWGSALGGFTSCAFLIPLLGTDKTLYSILALSLIFIWPVYKSGHKKQKNLKNRGILH